ncbi:hypothetical protein HGI09_14130 [Streptomyces collinus]|nr:hypothetical protein HGI10_49990 [Streptomyces collinus]UJA14112.1 hypothetical protein HGI09_14130 [Streptomyces collinus]
MTPQDKWERGGVQGVGRLLQGGCQWHQLTGLSG